MVQERKGPQTQATWGVWEFGGPTTHGLSPTELKKRTKSFESGLRYATEAVESDVSYAATRIRERVRRLGANLAEIGALPVEDVIIDGERTTATILRSEMIGTYLGSDGVLRTYSYAAGEHAGLPILSQDTPTDIEIINTRGLWMKALSNAFTTFNDRQSQDSTK